MKVVKVKKNENGKPIGRGYIYKYGSLELSEGDLVKVYLGEDYVEGIVIEGPHEVDGHSLPYPASLVKTITEKIQSTKQIKSLEKMTRHLSYAKKELIISKAKKSQQNEIFSFFNENIKSMIKDKNIFISFLEMIYPIQLPFIELPSQLFEIAQKHELTLNMYEILFARGYKLKDIATKAFICSNELDVQYLIQMGLNVQEVMFLNTLNEVTSVKQAKTLYDFFKSIGVDINVVDREKKTYIHTIKNPIILDLLLAEMKPNKLDKHRMTGLGYAILSCNNNLIEYLLSKKAKLNNQTTKEYDLNAIFLYIDSNIFEIIERDRLISDFKILYKEIKPIIEVIIRYPNIRWTTSYASDLIECIIKTNAYKEYYQDLYTIFSEQIERDSTRYKLYNFIAEPIESVQDIHIENIDKSVVSNFLHHKNWDAILYLLEHKLVSIDHFFINNQLDVLLANEINKVSNLFIDKLINESKEMELFKALLVSVKENEINVESLSKKLQKNQYNIFSKIKFDKEYLNEGLEVSISLFAKLGFQYSIKDLCCKWHSNQYRIDVNFYGSEGAIFYYQSVEHNCIKDYIIKTYSERIECFINDFLKYKGDLRDLSYYFEFIYNEVDKIDIFEDTTFNNYDFDDFNYKFLHKLNIANMKQETLKSFIKILSQEANEMVNEIWEIFEINKLKEVITIEFINNIIHTNNYKLLHYLFNHGLIDLNKYNSMKKECIECGHIRMLLIIDQFKMKESEKNSWQKKN